MPKQARARIGAVMETTDLSLLEKSFDLAEERLAGAAGTPWTAPTPCARWTLRHLANHLIALPTVLARSVAGVRLGPEEFSPDKMAADDYFGAHPCGTEAAGLFTAAAAKALKACRVPGALTGSVTMHRGAVPLRGLVTATVSDTAAHAWDLARATDQDPALPDDLAETALAFMTTFISPGARIGEHPHFAPEVAIPTGACPTDRLVAFLGRTP
jgi:uncharacterized protein (TIGR03086 family)